MRTTRLAGIAAALATALALVHGAAAEPLDADRLFDPERLLEIRIEITPRHWAELCRQPPDGSVFSGEGAKGSSYTYFRADLWIGDTKIPSVGVRKKGLFGSNDGQRPSLKVKFDEFIEQDPIRGASRLTLNNNKQDQSLVSQLLTYQLFRDGGVAAPRCSFARLTVNGEYLGIYSNIESIKKPFLKRSFGSSKGNLYEGQITDFHPRAVNNIEVKNNESENDRSDIKRLAELLAEPGALRVDELEKILDLDQFLRYWAIESLTGFWDGYAANQNNFYVYFDPETNKGRFIPWGADWAFTSSGPFGGFGQRVNSVYAQSILTNRLYHTSGIPQRYRQTMQQILDTAWDESEMLQRIERAEALLTPLLGSTQRGAPQAMEQVREFIRSRKRRVLEELARGPVAIPREPRKPAYLVAVGKASGTFDTRFGAAVESPEKNAAEIELTLDRKRVALRQVAVATQFVTFPGFGRGGFGGPAPGGFGGGQGGFQAPVTMTLTGIRENAQPMTITLTIDREEFRPGDDRIEVRGRLTEGRAAFGGGFGPGGGASGGANRTVAGTLRLKQASIQAGEPVSGDFELEILETRGGIFGGSGFGGPGFGGPGFGGELNRVLTLLGALDADRDGVLSGEEIAGAAEALRTLDRNRDGALAAEEWSAPARGPSGSERGR